VSSETVFESRERYACFIVRYSHQAAQALPVRMFMNLAPAHTPVVLPSMNFNRCPV
jgi:hypothetical protein